MSTPEPYMIDQLTNRMRNGDSLLSEQLLSAKRTPFYTIFIAVFIFLYIYRPSFILEKTPTSLKFSYKCFLFYWLVFSILLSIGWYAYTMKPKN